MLISLIVILGIAAFAAYLLKVELHLYSLAGLTLAFGMVIDNTLVMSEHLLQNRNKKVIIALLSSTLTTLGALAIVYALGEGVRLLLIDFVQVMSFSLLASLVVSYWFLPAIMVYMPYQHSDSALSMRVKRRIVVSLDTYRKLIIFTQKTGRLWLFVSILGFGLPVFLLPAKVEGWRFYNQTIGSEQYQKVY